MKKIVGIALLAALCMGAGRAQAQGGEDILRFSRYNYSFGTARSAAMGGAFVSLGADLSSMTLNPAGLGMYRGSEFSISPSFSSLNIKTAGGYESTGSFGESMNKGNFALNNVGAAFNVYAGSGALTAVTFGFNYNKLIDLNSNMGVVGRAGGFGGSMLDMFVEQLSNYNVNPDEIGGYLDAGTFPSGDFGMLGALQAYDAYLTDKPVIGGGGWYSYGLPGVTTDAITNSDFRRTTKGSVGQYDLGMGVNLSNRVYLGFGLGIQEINYRETSDYYETFEGNAAPDPERIADWSRVQVLDQDGSAVNVKLGAIVRPTDALRIGVAFHTPTWIHMEEVYTSDVYGNFGGVVPDLNSAASHSASAAFESEYRMNTPMRLMGGISYNFFDMAILSLDYERVWYNQMKLFWESPGWDGSFDDEDPAVTDEVKAAYRPANNLRVGLETMVAPGLFARAGYAYYDSMYKDPSLKDYATASNYSAGLGYRTGTWGVDLAYVYMDTEDAPRSLYDYTSTASGTLFRSGVYTAKQLRHNVTATLSMRF